MSEASREKILSVIEEFETRAEKAEAENDQLKAILKRQYKKSGICPICGLSRYRHTDRCWFADETK